MEPLSVGLGLLALYLLGPHEPGLLIAALIVGGVSLALFAVMASLLGGTFGSLVGAAAIIAIGIALVIRAMIRPPAPKL